jgi:hypothetical protein
MNPPDPKKDWLEPPEWWRKWRPLRWLAGVLVLTALYLWLWPSAPPPPPPSRPAAVPPAVIVTPSPSPTSTATPTPIPTPTPTPTSTATPAPAATPTASPTPTSEPEPELSAVEAEVYFEESLAQETDELELAAFTRIESERVRLLGPYRSYQGVDEVVVGLERSGFLPMVESRHLPVRDGVPPRNLDTVTVNQYRHWDVPGRLELQFFNDRLYQTEFEPEDAERYVAAQRRELPQLTRRGSGRSELIVGNLRIASSLDLAVSQVGQQLRTRPFLIWQDRRLVRQREEWDRRFAAAAAP